MAEQCAIFFYEGYVDTAPTIINLSKTLADTGHSVHIYASNKRYASSHSVGDGIAVHYVDSIPDIPGLLRLTEPIRHYPNFALYKDGNKREGFRFKLKKLSLFTAFGFYTSINLILFVVNYGIYRFLKRQWCPCAKVNIGVDTYGSILALFNYYIRREKFIYLSLELNEPQQLGVLGWPIRWLERLALRKSESVIIQDADRFKTLCEYQNYQHPSVFYLPNTGYMPKGAKDVFEGSNNYFRDLFHLDPSLYPYIVLHAGMTNDITCSKAIAQTFASLNHGCALILHDSEGKGAKDPYIQSLQHTNDKNLFLSLKPVAFDQLDQLYQSASIGLALYSNVDSSFMKISLASGKLAYYLKHGKPVLVSYSESLQALVDEYEIGCVIRDPSCVAEVELALDKILKNYTDYSNNCRRCFREKFDSERVINSLLSHISHCC